MRIRAALLLLLFALGGCSLFPLSEADCKPASWRERGYADGFAGHPPQDLRLIPECRERFGVEIGREDYLAGWKHGYDEWDRQMGSMGID
jgi:hypothetical protein